MAYWMTATLTALPFFLWVYIGIGVPLALALLPRVDWLDRVLVLALAFALGSGLLTLIMFILGSSGQPWITRPNLSIALVIMTIGAIVLAARKSSTNRGDPPPIVPRRPFTPGEITLIGMLIVAVAIRWLITAYWPFTAYDALWVYGYEGRLYTLEGMIPSTIGYYPQYLPLQYTFAQVMIGGIDDSAARAGLPLLHIGSILAAYLLGARLFNRRTGILLASLWGLYPAVGTWARMGDLEIPLTFLLTLTAVFFFSAWYGQRPRHYALIAGIVYGIALWTKPTAGAFALGVMFINAIEVVRLRFDWAAYRPRFVTSLIVALASAPMGGMWYIRNLILGHNPVDFPPEFWHTLAERGGGQLLWGGAGLLVLTAYLYATQPDPPRRRPMVLGMAFVLLGMMPSALARFVPITPDALIVRLYPSLVGLPRLGLLEWGLIIAGLIVLGRELIPYGQKHLVVTARTTTARVGWALALAFPYFVTYFWRYSYHPRLSFAIVPLLALPAAVIVAAWFPSVNVRAWKAWQRYALMMGMFAAALPGMVLPLYDKFVGWDYLWSGELPDDTAKRTSGNEALMWMVDGFRIYEEEHGEPPVVVAPGVNRLPFFFPQADIRHAVAPDRLSDLAGVTYFVDSHPDGTGAYGDPPTPPLGNQVLSALGRTDIMRKAWWKDDGIFRYEIYELHLERRFEAATPHSTYDDEVIVGGFARLVGHELSSTDFEIGQRRTIKLFWEVLEAPDADYMTYIHLRDADGNLHMAWDGPVGQTEDGRYYTTLQWERGETIIDDRLERLTNREIPVGEGYQLVVGMYDLLNGERLPITRNGEPAGDGVVISDVIQVIPPVDDPD